MGFAAFAFLVLVSGFADQLYVQGDYRMAALEYSRVLYEEGDTLSHPQEALRLARCRHLMGEYEESLSIYTYLAEGLPEGDDRAMALMGAGSVYTDLGIHTLAREAYLEASITAADSELVFRGQLLNALSPMHRYDWSRSAGELYLMAGNWSGDRGVLAGRLSVIAAGGEELPGRSPFWCGLASAILPGSGQIICGHTKDGLIALGMTAATGVLFYSSLEEENLSTSILLGWLSLSFYGANIFGGSRAAEYYNASRRRELLEEVYQTLEDREQQMTYPN